LNPVGILFQQIKVAIFYVSVRGYGTFVVWMALQQ